MARLPRLYAPDTAQLVQTSFAHALAKPTEITPATQLQLLATWLQEGASEHRVAVHGWVILNDRLAFLATPPSPNAIAKLIQTVARRFATRLQHGRVFDGRYRSALIQPGLWVLPALAWLDLLPVQHQYVEQADNWPWSSGAEHLGITTTASNWITHHPDYWHEGNTSFDRQARYRQRLNAGLSSAQQGQIEQALFGQWALGDPAFLEKIQSQATRRVAPTTRGRPKKTTAAH